MFNNRNAIMVLLAFGAGMQAQAQTHDHSRMDHDMHSATTDTSQRQAEVARRGKDVMEFDLAKTVHIFTRRADGGVQQVVARTPDDLAQVRLVRRHLRKIQRQFLQGDFSGPSHIHGQDMPGLAQLQATKPGQIAITYQDVPGGAELRYSSADPALVDALFQWFDAQVHDHGKDAIRGSADPGSSQGQRAKP